ncbi:phosphate signaling complex protein PhoU [soil metagenome]
MTTENKHILGRFNEALETLRNDILRMASITSENLRHAMAGLLARDDDRCNRAIAEDEDVDQLEKTIDREGLDIILRFSPVASDLRHVISTMKMSNNLERISDQATSIAKRARRLNRHAKIPEVHLIEPVYETALSMLHDAVRAFKDSDIATSLELDARDDELDRAHKILIKNFTSRAESEAGRAEDYIDLIFIVRFLERVGDHAVNIGEDCVYAHSAHDIRHGGQRPTPT